MELRVQKIVENAVVPAKAHSTDSGFDLTVIHVVKENFGPGVVLYGTGLKIAPPENCYTEVIARSSLCKLGWFIANSVGVIDADYRGELCIPLAKIHPDAQPLELPARVAQLIIRPLICPELRMVEELDETVRGEGGFGSSGSSSEQIK